MNTQRWSAPCRRLLSCAVLATVVVLLLPVLPVPDLPMNLSAGSSEVVAQSRQSARAQKRQLKRLQRSIEKTRSEIRQMKKKETSVVRSLNLYRRHSEELASSLELLNTELTRMQDSIAGHERSLAVLQDELRKLQDSYAELARALQKAGSTSDQELILTGQSYEQDVRHDRYMQHITELANARAEEIVQLKQRILEHKIELDTMLSQNLRMKERKSVEQEELHNMIASSNKVLKDIRKNRSMLQQQLKEKRQSAEKVQRIITLLAAKEKQRKLEEKRRREEAAKRARASAGQKGEAPRRGGSFTGGDAPDNPQTPAKGVFGRKSLPWPVSSRTIVHKFGTSTNPVTKVTTENLGIGIKTARGTPVGAVHEGTVSLVHWLPGYGSLVIVDHGNGFRTVYANLSAVLVAEGQRIKAGEPVGRSGESVDGEYVHFEIWRDREKLNPSEWLN